MSYNDIVDYMNWDLNIYDGEYWQYWKIIGHHKVLTDHPTYKGSSTNLKILWENGDETEEPLQKFGDDTPVDCAIYAKKHGLLNKPGWRQFKHITKREGLLNCLIHQARLRSFWTSPKFKFGCEVPRDIKHAIRLDDAAGNKNGKLQISWNKINFVSILLFMTKGSFTSPRYLEDTRKLKSIQCLMLNMMAITKLGA